MTDGTPTLDERTLSALLEDLGVPHQLIEVPGHSRTAHEAAAELRVPVGQIVKSLVCRADEELLVVLIPGDRALSLTKLRELTGTRRCRLAPRQQVESATGYAVGGVAPIGLAQRLRVLGDERLRELDAVYCGGGSVRHMLLIDPSDLERIAAVEWADLSDDNVTDRPDEVGRE
jgi:Cys-tRNA(Pro) deacylase